MGREMAKERNGVLHFLLKEENLERFNIPTR